MALPSNPQTLATYDITKPDQAKVFVKKVSDLFLAISGTLSSDFTTGFIAGLLNGNAALFNSALFYKTVDLGTVTTNQAVDCVNASGVSIRILFTASVSLTLNHLALGVPVTIEAGNSSGGALTFSMAATQPGGTAYTNVYWKTNAGFTNMGTGLSMGGGSTMVAAGSANPNLNWSLMMVSN
jgi:hypothetical protein